MPFRYGELLILEASFFSGDTMHRVTRDRYGVLPYQRVLRAKLWHDRDPIAPMTSQRSARSMFTWRETPVSHLNPRVFPVTARNVPVATGADAT